MSSSVDESQQSADVPGHLQAETSSGDAAPTTTTTTTTSSSTKDGKQEPPYTFEFKVGEKAIVSHCDLMYLAKILETDPEKGYFVHYDGWNAKWDEWVTPDRVVTDTEENRTRAKQIEREFKARVSKRSSSAVPTSTTSSKRKRDAEEADDPQDDEAGETSTHVKLNLSEELKMVVVRDWENLTQHKKLLALPKPESKTVEKIMDDFLNTKKKAEVFAQVCQGLLVYFDRALPSILLYRAERTQYEKVHQEFPNKRNCQLYGGEHLLRLFVRLPQLLTNTDLDENETKQLCSRLQDFLRFLSKKSGEYFGGESGEGYIDDNSASEGAAPVSDAK